MSEILSDKIENISKNFIKNKDQFYYPNCNINNRVYRKLQAIEIETLVKNNNSAEDWNEIFVSSSFNPNLVVNNEFFGRIYIGDLTDKYLEYNDLRLPVGIYNSMIFSSEIGDNVAIRNVNYLSHYIIGNECILFNIDEMITSNRAKFGNGIIKEDEQENIRIKIEIANENGGRWILPFEGLLTSDAYLWSHNRDNKTFLNKLVEITDNEHTKTKGWYGTVGEKTVIKHCRIIKDVKIGSYTYIKGANKLKNLTICSSEKEPTQIGEGVELVNGIVGYSSKIFYGSKAIRFVMGRNTQLKYGARLINSVLGDNSTISCCELLNNLIFPFHEQHHNNSFLIAATVMGQSNIAAGATIGSNHNSRAADGEIVANRGFWPGLCTNFKHNCKFASFVLVAKSTYSYEMNISYPFSLVTNTTDNTGINIIPGYWFIYNMYALERNNYKFAKRDNRVTKDQNIELNYLAPDTVIEMLSSIERIKQLLKEQYPDIQDYSTLNDNEISLQDDESMNKYGAKIKHPIRAISIYTTICKFYVAQTFAQYFDLSHISVAELINKLIDLKEMHLYKNWVNLGGQIIGEETVDLLMNEITNGKISSWNEIHQVYNDSFEQYPTDKARHAIYVLETLLNKQLVDIQESDIEMLMLDSVATKKYIYKMAYTSREKDYQNPFKQMNYKNMDEMNVVLGDIKNNDFLEKLMKQTEEYSKEIQDFLEKSN